MTSKLLAVDRNSRTELWEIEPGVAALLPMVLDHYPSKLKRALTARRLAALTGSCKCGMTWDKDTAKKDETGKSIIEIEHENWCEATDENLKMLANKYAGRI